MNNTVHRIEKSVEITEDMNQKILKNVLKGLEVKL